MRGEGRQIEGSITTVYQVVEFDRFGLPVRRSNGGWSFQLPVPQPVMLPGDIDKYTEREL